MKEDNYDSYSDTDVIVVINVSGKRFETYQSTLDRFDYSLLGSKRRHKYYIKSRNEYFFDRNPSSFKHMFNYMQTGLLKTPTDVYEQVFKADLKFFGFYKEYEALYPDTLKVNMKRPRWRLVLRQIVDSSDSLAGKSFIMLSVTMILVSLILFGIETFPEMKEKSQEIQVLHFRLSIVDYTCMSWFVMEYCLRLLAADDRLRFLYHIVNLIDLLSILPFVILYCVRWKVQDPAVIAKMDHVKFLRVLRVVRIFMLSRYSVGMRILAKTLWFSLRELSMLMMSFVFCLIFFSAVMYLCEFESEDTQFYNILQSLWWASATLTTVGYGDIAPETTVGRGVAVICVLAGILIMAFPVPIISTNFSRLYSEAYSNKTPLQSHYCQEPLTFETVSQHRLSVVEAALPRVQTQQKTKDSPRTSFCDFRPTMKEK